MSYVDFVGRLHTATPRDYLDRVTAHDNAACAEVALHRGEDYWDGDRQHGYGGYRYDGRWRVVAEAMVAHYDLAPGARILDVGCGKGFLLYEFTQVLSSAEVHGIDVSRYGIENAKPEIRNRLDHVRAGALPWDDDAFDLVYSINTPHNLYNHELHAALGEMQRVGRGGKHITVESYRNEREKVNLLYWHLTCRAFLTPEEWEFAFAQAGYDGDYGCIYFE